MKKTQNIFRDSFKTLNNRNRVRNKSNTISFISKVTVKIDLIGNFKQRKSFTIYFARFKH